MNQKEEMGATLGDLILTSYTQVKNQEDKITMPLMLDVPVAWVNLIKTLAMDNEFGEIVELALKEFFALGVATHLKKIQKQYATPHDLIRRYKEIQSR